MTFEGYKILWRFHWQNWKTNRLGEDVVHRTKQNGRKKCRNILECQRSWSKAAKLTSGLNQATQIKARLWLNYKRTLTWSPRVRKVVSVQKESTRVVLASNDRTWMTYVQFENLSRSQTNFRIETDSRG